MANAEVLVFDARELSEQDSFNRIGRIAGAIAQEIGDNLVHGDITVVPIQGGVAVSRERLHENGRAVEFVDIRVGGTVTEGAEGRAFGPYRYNRASGDKLSSSTIFRHLLGMAEEVGVTVVLPENHKIKPLR